MDTNEKGRNAAGQRVVKKVYDEGVLKYTEITIKDLYDLKLNGDGSKEETIYYRANNELVAKKVIKGGVSELTYHHNDHLGSASMVTSSRGVEVEETKYLPYGSVRSGGSEKLTGKYTYTGQESDNETGLMYYGARYYSPEIGRFVQPDSMLPDMYDPQQLNRYAYVRNNPLKYVDPSGNYAEIIIFSAFQNVGSFYGEGSKTGLNLGHAMIRIDDTYYGITSYANIDEIEVNGKKIQNNIQIYTTEEFNEAYKDYVDGFNAYEINLTEEQESKIVEYFTTTPGDVDRYKEVLDYNLLGNSCAIAVVKSLQYAGVNDIPLRWGDVWTPSSLKAFLDKKGKDRPYEELFRYLTGRKKNYRYFYKTV